MADLKRTILTTLNHEFRTPLTYITTYTDMLRDTSVSAEDFRNFMRGIQVGSERLRRLVEDFIFLVELQTGEAAQTYERRCTLLTDLPLLLRVALERQRTKAEAKKVRLHEALEEPLPAVRGDQEYLLDAVSRLLDNAIKFSKKSGGQVTLRAGASDHQVRIEVQDEGIGMPADELGRIFDVFHQIDRAKMEQQGSGSGLAIVQSIAELHGGRVTATSVLGEGSTFRLEVPRAE
jgi:two-component system phosphate regulon sensor histidine kinase PhoR